MRARPCKELRLPRGEAGGEVFAGETLLLARCNHFGGTSLKGCFQEAAEGGMGVLLRSVFREADQIGAAQFGEEGFQHTAGEHQPEDRSAGQEIRVRLEGE